MSEKVEKVNKPLTAQTASRKVVPISQATPIEVDTSIGMTAEQVQIRYAEGLVNLDRTKMGKSVLGIILSNIFTYFNVIYFIIAAIFIYFGEFSQITFLAVVLCNTLISLVQELRSKRAIDKLKLIASLKATVLRDGEKTEIPVDDIVLGDIVYFKAGDQITADCVICSGSVDVNESILTGESENIAKKAGDTIFAGSYVVSNNCVAQVCKVGKYNFIGDLSSKARQHKKPKSQLFGSFKIILYIISVLIIPLAFLLYRVNSTVGVADNVVFTQTASPIIAIIPAGPFLLTSVALAVSVMRLAKNKTIVQQLYCIEMLARVDTLCLDKTGTLTDGSMRIVESIDLRGDGRMFVKDIISTLNADLQEQNLTGKALRDFYGDKRHPMLKATHIVPFSAVRKFSAVSYEGEGTYFLGAPEFILTNKNQRVDDIVSRYSKEGYRVLLLAQSTGNILEEKSGRITLPAVRRASAIIVIEDHIRPDAEETLKWFSDIGVDVKLISGDNPVTVGNIATRLNVKDADKIISLDGLTDDEVREIANEYTVFGRVTPAQKAILVTELKKCGHSVAMTGDGVNDILALREADCSIAMAEGSSAAQNVSHLVLQDNNFSALPNVVLEGRRVVNNIQNASSMFFMKTIFTIALMAFIIVADLVFNKQLLYPFSVTSIILMESFIVGFPTVFLALQKNTDRLQGNFLSNVLRRCLPASITFFLAFITTYFVYDALMITESPLPLTIDSFRTVTALIYTMCAFYALCMACRPFNALKTILVIFSGFAVLIGTLLLGTTLVSQESFLDYVALTREEILLMLTIGLSFFFVYILLYNLMNVWYKGKKK